ncbi:MAG: hypothetical protein KIT00_08550 [Rhodospirillales bacterium]|nr:hypothetical protein [Rhodospirillales bacterium]
MADDVETGVIEVELIVQLIADRDDPIVRMRAADALEKATRARPGLLIYVRQQLVDLLNTATQQEVRWHLAQIMPRLELSSAETEHVVVCLERYLDDRSSIVKTSALQALADFAARDVAQGCHVRGILKAALSKGTPAMQARARKLLRELEKTKPS